MRGEAKLRSAIGVTKEQPQAMIGKAPDCEAYRGLFGWPEAAVPIQCDGSDIMAGLNDLVPTRDEWPRSVDETLRRRCCITIGFTGGTKCFE